MDKIKTSLYRFFTKSDALSWVSHAWITSIAIWFFKLFRTQWYGYILACSFYLIREAGDIRRWFNTPKDERRPFHLKLWDGIGDLSSPAISGLMIIMSPDQLIATAVVALLGIVVIVDNMIREIV